MSGMPGAPATLTKYIDVLPEMAWETDNNVERLKPLISFCTRDAF